MSSQKVLDQLDPEFKPLVVALLAELKQDGIVCVATSGYRTFEEQNKEFAKGRTVPGKIVTKAKGGHSPHNYRLAVDICSINPHDGTLWWNAPDDIWNVIHILAEQRGYLDSGYDWKFCDRPHIEDPRWKHQRELWIEGKITI